MGAFDSFGGGQPAPQALLHGCSGNPAGEFAGPYPEVMSSCQHPTPTQYGGFRSHPASRLLPPAPHPLQPGPPSLLGYAGAAGGGDGPLVDMLGVPQGPPLGFGPYKQPAISDDPESDSGLSLGSSPPLASPGNAANPGASSYACAEGRGLGYCGGTPPDGGGRGRPERFYPADLQQAHNLYPYPAPPSAYYPPLPPMPPQLLQPAPPRPPQPFAPPPHPSHLKAPGPSGPPPCGPFGRPRGPSDAPLSRDQRRALALKIPFPLEKIVNLPVDDFNELLSRVPLSDAQLALVRDIRRRGKNKVAAQNCRKRKLENIALLEVELGRLRGRREVLGRQRDEYQRGLALARRRLADLHAEVFSRLRDERGQPCSPHRYSLQQTPDGGFYLVPRSGSELKAQSALAH